MRTTLARISTNPRQPSSGRLAPATFSPGEKGFSAPTRPLSLGERAGVRVRGADGSRSFFRSMRDRRRGGFVDEPAGAKAVEGEGRGERVRLAPGDRMREHMARARGRLEAAGAPAAIDEQSGNRRLADDRRA